MDNCIKIELIRAATIIVNESELITQPYKEAQELVLTAAKLLTTEFNKALSDKC